MHDLLPFDSHDVMMTHRPPPVLIGVEDKPWQGELFVGCTDHLIAVRDVTIPPYMRCTFDQALCCVRQHTPRFQTGVQSLPTFQTARHSFPPGADASREATLLCEYSSSVVLATGQ